METLSSLGIILGSSWTSGVNLYLTTAGLGIAHRLGWITLPGSMDTISHPLIITLAVLLYFIEFVADKIPYVDSAWDSVHTFIRPVGGGALAYLGAADAGPIIQTALTLVSGTIAMDSHLTKAGTRVAINASPEPVTNSVASVSEDAVVVGSLWLMIVHPIIIGALVLLFVIFSIWFIPKLFRFVKKGFGYLFGKQKSDSVPNP
jgi:hypothetical protein